MPVSFNSLPSTLRLPLFWGELDPSRAGTGTPYGRALVMGIRGSGAAPLLVPRRVASKVQALEAAGRGSQGADMLAKGWLVNNTFDEVWYLPLAEPSGGTAAANTATVTGPATASGIIPLYIGGDYVPVAVVAGDSANTMATKIAAAINADLDLVVTAAAATNVVTSTLRWKGSDGNDLDMRIGHRDEAMPAGVSVAVNAFTGGVGVPDVAAALAALADWPVYTFVLPWTDTASLDAFRDFMDYRGDVGRWSWAKQLFGRGITFKSGTAGALQTFGNARNDPSVRCYGYRGSPTPPWRAASQIAAVAHRSMLADPARPWHTLRVAGFLPAAVPQRFSSGEQNALSYDGISCLQEEVDDVVSIKTSFTMYQRNAFGTDDDAMLKSQTLDTMEYLLKSMRHRIESKYGRHKLGNDGTRYGPGQAILTPKVAKAEIGVSLYREWEHLGLVENARAFIEHLIVERDPTNPNRLNVLFPPDVINQLDVFAVLAQFRLQYPDKLPERALAIA
jgi:phage tail sheath gpL-like